MPKLTDIVKFVSLNRVNLLSLSMVAGGLATGIISDDRQVKVISFFSAYVGFATSCITAWGVPTYQAYKRTKEHIKEHNKLDIRFASKYKGEYCDRQGMYMAAKELGHLEDYKKIVKRNWRSIPNF